MTDMFSPAMLFFAALCVLCAVLPQYDFCTEHCQRLLKRLRTRKHTAGAEDLHKHA